VVCSTGVAPHCSMYSVGNKCLLEVCSEIQAHSSLMYNDCSKQHCKVVPQLLSIFRDVALCSLKKNLYGTTLAGVNSNLFCMHAV